MLTRKVLDTDEVRNNDAVALLKEAARHQLLQSVNTVMNNTWTEAGSNLNELEDGVVAGVVDGVLGNDLPSIIADE